MKSIEKISLFFENCEEISIPINRIGHFNTAPFTKRNVRLACNSISELIETNLLVMEINSKINDEINLHEDWYSEETKLSVFERILFNDLVGTSFKYDNDDEFETVYVPWGGPSDYTNESMKSMISDSGHLYLVVSNNKEDEELTAKEVVKKYFGSEVLSKEYKYLYCD